eukprot:Nk52_evm11s375 gene=Nk52_evmTU11s375
MGMGKAGERTLRRFQITPSVLERADGSCRLEILPRLSTSATRSEVDMKASNDNNQNQIQKPTPAPIVVAAVYGPVSESRQQRGLHYTQRGSGVDASSSASSCGDPTLKVVAQVIPSKGMSSTYRLREGIESLLEGVLRSACVVEGQRGSEMRVFIQVLQGGAGTGQTVMSGELVAAIMNAAIVAVVDAGVALRYMYGCVSVGKRKTTSTSSLDGAEGDMMVIDPDGVEEDELCDGISVVGTRLNFGPGEQGQPNVLFVKSVSGCGVDVEGIRAGVDAADGVGRMLAKSVTEYCSKLLLKA